MMLCPGGCPVRLLRPRGPDSLGCEDWEMQWAARLWSAAAGDPSAAVGMPRRRDLTR
jgi:hypothetical protein